MSNINWSFEDVDASDLRGSPDKGYLELPNGFTLRWASPGGYRVYYVNDEPIYDPAMVDKLSVIAAIAVEDVLVELEREHGVH